MLGSAEAYLFAITSVMLWHCSVSLGKREKKNSDLTILKTMIYQYSLEISAVDAATKKHATYCYQAVRVVQNTVENEI